MIVLDANNSNHVTGARNIDVEIGQANRRMLIFSGIACPEFGVNDDDRAYTQTCTVNLRHTVLAIDQATVSIGLASIDNDDTSFLFAANNAGVDIDPDTQELLIRVDMALSGEHTHLHRFGYQVVATVTTQATGISGRILWNRSIFDAHALTLNQIAQTFRITANLVERITPPPGTLTFAYDKYTPVAYGFAKGFSSEGADFVVPYEIPGAPYNQNLVVQVEVGSQFLTAGSPGAGQVAGPNPVRLTVTSPGIAGVDFRIGTLILR